MDEQEIRSIATEVLAGIAPEIDLATIDEDADLREALDLDSMDFLNFVIGLGQRCGRKIPEADTPKLHTLQGVVDYLLRA